MGLKEKKVTKLMEEVTKCPACGKKTFKIRIYYYNIPYVGDILIESAKCRSCGYKWSNIELAQHGPPKRIVAKIRNVEGLNALVIKSSKATVLIPELGIEIYPGPAAPGYITTVEGILHRVLDHVPQECLGPEKECYKKVELIEKAIGGSVPFTLIIEDPSGKSLIKGNNLIIKEENLGYNSTQP